MRSFERRIYLGILFIVCGFMPIIALSFWSLQKIVNEQKELISANAQEMFLAQHLANINATQMSLIPVFVLSGNKNFIEEYEKLNHKFEQTVLDLLKSEFEPESREIAIHIQAASRRLYRIGEPGIRMRLEGHSIKEVNAYFSQAVGPSSQELQKLLSQLIARESQDMERAKSHLHSSVNWIMNSLILLLLIAFGLFIFIGRLIVKSVRQKVAYDESQLALLNQERELSQARKEAVEVVAHDLKNPLGTIKMSVAMMLEDLANNIAPQELQESLEMVSRSTDSMERLIKDLLDHAKIEAGQLILEKSKCDLGLLTLDLVKRFRPLAQRRNILITSNVTVGTLIASCDLGRIEQVLSNLIGNALKFTPTQGHISVEAEIQKDLILFAVTDNGIGIAKEQLPHVFDRFWQVRATASQGNGLGLAIAKAIVDGHGGEIWVDSAPGKGSKFCFTLPRIKPTETSLPFPVASL